LFFVKKSIQSRFHSYAFAARGGEGGYLCFLLLFFFRRFAEEFVVLKMYSAHQKSAREALDTPPREAGIPSLARETHRLIIFARGFFGEEDKETGSFKREGHIPTQYIKSEKIIRVGHFLARGNICFLCAREDRERRDNRRSALRNTSRYQKRI
jgi:hypothetical protein